MTKRRWLLLALSLGTSAAIAVTVWLLGFENAANAIGLLTAAIALVSAAVGWLVPGPGAIGGRPPADPGADPTAATPPSGPTARTRTGRARRLALVVASTLAPVLVITGVMLLVRRLDDDRPVIPGTAGDGTASSRPSPGASSAAPTGGAPSSAPTAPGGSSPTGRVTPIVDPPPPSPTRNKKGGTTTPRPVNSVSAAEPWNAPAGTPEWTLYDTDTVKFLPSPRYIARAGTGDLAFQLNTHQINWWQWTDSDDLSYEGCRSPSATRWDGLKLDLFTTPRTYCRQEPEDPGTVSYVQFTAKDMNADPPYVKVRVWVYSP